MLDLNTRVSWYHEAGTLQLGPGDSVELVTVVARSSVCNLGTVIKGTEAVQEAGQVSLKSKSLVGGKLVCGKLVCVGIL